MRNKSIAVIGLGRFGSAIARKLSARGADVLAIDVDEEKVEALKDEVAYAVSLDSTDSKALLAQNIQEMDAVIIAIGADFEALVLTAYTLLELDIKRIIARAQDRVQKKILEKMGIKEVLSLEDEVSNNVAEQLINPSVLMSIQLPDDYEIVEIVAPPSIEGRTLADIGLREKYNLNLVTLLRKRNDDKHHIMGVPEPKTVIETGDIIIIFGTAKNIDRFIEINK